MRPSRSFCVGTFLLLQGEQLFTRTANGFTIRPTTVPSPTLCTSTLLGLSAKPKAPPSHAVTLQSLEESPFDDVDDDELQKVLSTLEKRVKEGPGSLSFLEVELMKMGSDRLLREIKKKNKAEADKSSKATTAAQTTSAPIESPAPVQKASPAQVSSHQVSVSPSPAVENSASKEVTTDVSDDNDEESMHSGYGMDDLYTAVSQVDATTVSTLIKAGVEMDEATTDAAFWAVVKEVDRAEQQDEPLSADVPRMLHHIFDADLRHLQSREQLRTNVTCMQPREDGVEGSARRMNYIFDDMSHRDLPLTEGRKCEGGSCCDACSRNIFPTFASDAETNFETFPDLTSLTFNELTNVPAATILQFTRLIERVRRTIAYEYGLPLKSILPLQAYSRRYVAGTTQQGGGGGEGDFVTLHTDEATHDGYHYSCVLYLNSQGEDFEGGDFVFNDPAEPSADAAESDDDEDDEEESGLSLIEEIRRAGRKLTPFHPTKGSAVIFSSGWENMHEVETITSGTRYTVPCFFTTCPVPEAHYELMVVGKPKTDEDIADDWLHLLLAHRTETPLEATGRVKELLMKWHYMCAPLSQH